jgi:hypothetical protein
MVKKWGFGAIGGTEWGEKGKRQVAMRGGRCVVYKR